MNDAAFLHPDRLWWLLAAPFLLLFVSAIGTRKRATPARLASVLLRTALVAIPILLLAGPVALSTETAPPRVDVLIDASRSVPPVARERAAEAVAAWGKADGAPVTRVLEFGDLVSDPNPAFARAVLLDPAASPPMLALFTDGAVEAPAEFVAAAAKGRPPALVIQAAAGSGFNVRLDEVRAEPDPARPDERALRISGSSSAEAGGTMRVLVDGREVRAHPVNVPAGPFDIAVPAGVIAPGRHVLGVWFDGSDAEPLDDELGLIVDVPAPAPVLLVAPEGRSLLSAALKAQDIAHDVITPPDVVQTPALLERAQVLVLDRVAIDGLSAPAIATRVTALLLRGGGVMFVPRDTPGELVPGASRAFLDLLPFVGRPLEPKKEPPPKKPPPDKEGMKPPEPEKKKIERRPAPTLGLLLLIDSSSSMRGQNLRLAKEAAIAAAEALHPDDRIGVIAFNDDPVTLLPMTRAGDRDAIIDLITRIKADGGTDFGPALDQARETLRNESLQIKHCVLLSDGFSRLGKILERVDNLVRDGVTLSTVGIGPGADIGTLSDMAAHGRGKYNPADSAAALPQIIVVEAQRVITTGGARRPFEIEVTKDEPPAAPLPEPPKAEPDPPPDPETLAVDAPKIATPIRTAWPAPYLKGVQPETTQGIFEWHRVDPAPHGWVALATKDGDPVAVHTYLGFGRLVALTLPMQGSAAGPLANWDDFANFTSQVVRFLTPATRPERFSLRIAAAGRAARLDIVDVERKPGIDQRLRFQFRDQRARPVAMDVKNVGPAAFALEVPADSSAAFIDVAVAVEGESGGGAGAFRVGRAPEIAQRGVDLAGLNRWAEALGGKVAASAPAALGLPPVVTVTRSLASPWWLVLMIPLFLLDLLVKRVFPGSFT